MSEFKVAAEIAWGGYLTFVFEQGELPDDPDEIRAMKAEFLSGFDE